MLYNSFFSNLECPSPFCSKYKHHPECEIGFDHLLLIQNKFSHGIPEHTVFFIKKIENRGLMIGGICAGDMCCAYFFVDFFAMIWGKALSKPMKVLNFRANPKFF